MSCLKRLRRSYPYIAMLHNDIKQNRDKVAVLKSLPDFVVRDLVEILYNMLQGNCKITKSQLTRLQRQKKKLANFYQSIRNAKTQKARKAVLYKQKGGFLGAVLPVLSTIASGLLRSGAF